MNVSFSPPAWKPFVTQVLTSPTSNKPLHSVDEDEEEPQREPKGNEHVLRAGTTRSKHRPPQVVVPHGTARTTSFGPFGPFILPPLQISAERYSSVPKVTQPKAYCTRQRQAEKSSEGHQVQLPSSMFSPSSQQGE